MKSVPYAPVVDSLMYAMVATWPDIAHAIGVINRFMHNPGRSHWNVVKHVFKYMSDTKDYDILFGLNKTSDVVGYTLIKVNGVMYVIHNVLVSSH